MAKTAIVKARVDEELLNQLDLLVADSGVGDRSDHIRRALQLYLSSQRPTSAYHDGADLSPVRESEASDD